MKNTFSPPFEDLQGEKPLKFIGPRSFDPNAWRMIVQHLGEQGRMFSIATGSHHADWLRHEWTYMPPRATRAASSG
ncbi:hypothetical protein AWV80_20970 [Cupriavidus sp. UYMU48A]|nr:hypothetical protein AWV80_20970 [Cupriavidus sp. UYMU48A]